MERRSFVNTVIISAILLVILPLLAAIAAVMAHVGLEATGGAGMGMFAPLGGMHAVMAGWLILALTIVAALVAILIQDTRQHA